MQKILLSTILFAFSHLVQAQLTVQGDSLISLRGNQIRLSKQGFPEQMDGLLAENIHFHFIRQSDGKDIRLTSGGVHFTRRHRRSVAWNDTSTSDELRVEVTAGVRSNGYFTYRVRAVALQDLDLKDISMHIPLQPERAKLIQGLGLQYGPRPDSNYRWKWAPGQKNPVSAWIGTENEGLEYSLVPGAWDKGGKGGTIVGIKGRSMLVNNYSGPRHLHKGDSLDYYFVLLVRKGK